LETDGADLREASGLCTGSGLETDLLVTDGADLREASGLCTGSGLETDLLETDADAFVLLEELLLGPVEAYSLFDEDTDLLPWSFLP
jgi:hypothetical protein